MARADLFKDADFLNRIITAIFSEILFLNISDSSSPGYVPSTTVTFGVISPGGRNGKLIYFSLCVNS